jgi:hypothetical protein
MRILYTSVENILKKVDFNALWPHFIMLGEEFIPGPVLVELKPGTYNEVISYTRLLK